MNKTYRLLDEGLPFKVIRLRGKLVGRVCRHGDGGFLGIINGVDRVRARTEDEAFREVASRALGYADFATLKARKDVVRRTNAAKKAEVREITNRILGGDFAAIDRLFEMEKRK